MLVLIAVDIVTRWLFNFSFEVSDEVGGYMLVVISFVSLSACHVSGSFHEVEFVQARLTPRARSLSQLIFGLLSLAACGLLAWQYVRLELSSWRFGDVAPTYLGDAALAAAARDGARHDRALLLAVPDDRRRGEKAAAPVGRRRRRDVA